MKYVRQFWIILLISAMGEALHVLIPLPVPASVYGLVIMLIALGTHIIRLEQVKEAAEFLIEIMPVMFIPAGVGLLTAWGILKPVCVPISYAFRPHLSVCRNDSMSRVRSIAMRYWVFVHHQQENWCQKNLLLLPM